MNIEEAVDMLVSRAAIQDALARYCQSLDRRDKERLKTVFWPDGHDDHGMYVGNIQDFIDFSMESLKTFDRTMHMIANCVIEFDDRDHARSETYLVAYHDLPGGETGTMHVVAGGRYLDKFERRSGEWRILERTYILDWNQNGPSTSDWDGEMYAQLTRRGQRFPDDAAFGFLKSPDERANAFKFATAS
jgi:3-phenylpropionate/cinnamic acid dioxygenase small subunit